MQGLWRVEVLLYEETRTPVGIVYNVETDVGEGKVDSA